MADTVSLAIYRGTSPLVGRDDFSRLSDELLLKVGELKNGHRKVTGAKGFIHLN